MTTTQRDQLIKTFEELKLQADIAEQRNRLVKNNYEELIYSLRLDQLKNPEKYDGYKDRENSKTE